jgi:hypothetical protein
VRQVLVWTWWSRSRLGERVPKKSRSDRRSRFMIFTTEGSPKRTQKQIKSHIGVCWTVSSPKLSWWNPDFAATRSESRSKGDTRHHVQAVASLSFFFVFCHSVELIERLSLYLTVLKFPLSQLIISTGEWFSIVFI